MPSDAPGSAPAADFARLDGRVAVVTGAASGIGRAIAVELARGGAAALLIATGHNASGLDETAARVAAVAPRCAVDRFVGDLADPSVREALLGRATAIGPDGPHVFVHVAGLDVLTGPAAKWSFTQKLERLWAVDVAATIDLARRVGAAMQAARRRTRPAVVGDADAEDDGAGDAGATTPYVLLTVGWDQAEHGQAGDAGQMFGAVKGAVMAFTRSLAKTLAPEVRVACLAPGWIKTKWAQTAASRSWRDRAAAESLAGRFGTPEEVAAVARLLASDAGAYLGGPVIPVNGGLAWGVDRPAPSPDSDA